MFTMLSMAAPPQMYRLLGGRGRGDHGGRGRGDHGGKGKGDHGGGTRVRLGVTLVVVLFQYGFTGKQVGEFSFS